MNRNKHRQFSLRVALISLQSQTTLFNNLQQPINSFILCRLQFLYCMKKWPQMAMFIYFDGSNLSQSGFCALCWPYCWSFIVLVSPSHFLLTKTDFTPLLKSESELFLSCKEWKAALILFLHLINSHRHYWPFLFLISSITLKKSKI